MKKHLFILIFAPLLLLAQPKVSLQVLANLHMTPLTIGQIANVANVKKVVLSHRMLRTLGKESETKKEIRKNYKGPLKFTNDLSLYKVH